MLLSPKCKLWSAGVAAAFLTVTSAFLIGFWPAIFDAVLYKQLVLTPTSYSYGLWEVTPIPVYIDFYLWSWTNPEDIYHHDPEVRKPKLVQLGPYVYREDRRKIVLSWNKDNGTVTFLQKKTWEYEPSLSTGSLDDEVTTINIPACAAVFSIRDYLSWIKTVLEGAMRTLNTPLYVTRKVREFLFEGYKDPLLDLAKIVPPGLLPITIPFDKFGWFYSRNESIDYEGVFNMFTGESDIQKFGKLGQWNYENPTSKYANQCGILDGSAGEFFLPKPKKGGQVSLFSPDICRTLTLDYKEEVKVEGIKAYRYWGSESTLKNLESCYCPSGDCAPHGAIDVSPCKWSAPAFVSFPHFFNADPHYREAVQGMKPDKDKHQMLLDLERRTGIPVQVEASLQINILLQPFEEYTIFRNVPKIYFPIIWFKERALIDDEIGPQVRLVSRIPDAGYILFGAILSTGVTSLCIVAIYYLKYRRTRTRN